MVLELPAGPLKVRAVEGRLVQVLRNLIGNARSFSPPGGTIRLRALEAGSMVEIDVEDDGPGIPASKLEHVFDRFYSERPAGERFGQHSGLGLSISRQIVEALKGRIAAENRRDETGQTSAPGLSCGCRKPDVSRETRQSSARHSAKSQAASLCARFRPTNPSRCNFTQAAPPATGMAYCSSAPQARVNPTSCSACSTVVSSSSPTIASTSPPVAAQPCRRRLAGLLEIRGLGIVRLPYVAPVSLALAVELGPRPAAARPGPTRYRAAAGRHRSRACLGAARVSVALDCALGRAAQLAGAFA